MPFRFVVDHTNKLIKRETWGVFDDDEAIEARRQYIAIPEIYTYDEIYDYLKVENYAVSPDLVKRLAAESRDSNKWHWGGKRSAVIANHDVTWGMLRMYVSYRENPQHAVRFFETIDSAIAWLNEDHRRLAAAC